MPILGAHMSIAGGYYKAVEAAAKLKLDCVQIFTKNNNQWRAKPIIDEEARRFKQRLEDLKVSHPLSHTSYLINLASPDRELRKKSIDAMVVELQRAEQLGIPAVVLHPGSYTASSEEQGLKAIVQSLDEVFGQTRELRCQCLLENTAGQGTNLGWRFEQLATLLDGVNDSDRLGVCFDTCHALAAGYSIENEKGYRSTMREFNRLVGVERIEAIHLNDSKRELGSRVDRHEHIGQGHIGLDGFRSLLNDRRFHKTPMYLETPKGDCDGEPWDEVNLRTLRELLDD